MRHNKCSIDRTNKNGFLPSLEGVSLNSLTDDVKRSIETFIFKRDFVYIYDIITLCNTKINPNNIYEFVLSLTKDKMTIN